MTVPDAAQFRRLDWWAKLLGRLTHVGALFVILGVIVSNDDLPEQMRGDIH
jgi:hypothetical protein